MKYIRTKKGEIGKLDNTEAYIKGKWYSVDEIKDYIIAQADTIEELCDEFVLFYEDIKNELPIPYATYERRGIWQSEKQRKKVINEVVNHPDYRKPVLYGAIWTNKGLMYVAKMNSKGELKLI